MLYANNSPFDWFVNWGATSLSQKETYQVPRIVGRYLEFQKNRPFSTENASFIRGNSLLSLHFQ